MLCKASIASRGDNIDKYIMCGQPNKIQYRFVQDEEEGEKEEINAIVILIWLFCRFKSAKQIEEMKRKIWTYKESMKRVNRVNAVWLCVFAFIRVEELLVLSVYYIFANKVNNVY